MENKCCEKCSNKYVGNTQMCLLDPCSCHQPQEERKCSECGQTLTIKAHNGDGNSRFCGICGQPVEENPQDPIKCQIRQPHYSCSDCKEEEKPQWEKEFDNNFYIEDYKNDYPTTALQERWLSKNQMEIIKTFIRYHKERWEKAERERILGILPKEKDEREAKKNANTYALDLAIGWNECLEEVKRIINSK